jgi:gas vesicle protein
MEPEKETADTSTQSRHVGVALTFLLIGLGAGALAGYVYAPRTGKQARKKLRRQFNYAKGTVGDWSGDARDLAGDALERGAALAEEFIDKVGPLLSRFKR